MNAQISFIPVKMRLPLKFGAETIDSIQIAHADVEAYGCKGQGETPLSVAWAWPSQLGFAVREKLMCSFCTLLAENLPQEKSDPMSVSYGFMENTLPELLKKFNSDNGCDMPHLAALICYSAFDIALHDAFGIAKNLPTYRTYNAEFMEHDLEYFFKDKKFAGLYPQDFFVSELPETLPVWHLVGGKDLLCDSEKNGSEIADGYPVTLEKWIERDGLKCLKIKLTGSDPQWDYQRLVSVGKIAIKYGCEALSPDFNCLVKSVGYVNDILDKLQAEYPEIFALIAYVEQPFPYDLEANKINVHSCSARKDLFMDESAHDWKLVKLGFSLGWNGVALKVCKSQTGALLSACWAKANDMKLMVQDLTNPRYAQIPHVLLAAHVGTIKGVECNAPQFYPEASLNFEKVHPGLYERRNGVVVIKSLTGNGLSMK